MADKNPTAFIHAACYVRVSTDKQEELSPDAQKRLLLDYAKSHNMLVSPDHLFIENGISGRKAEKRPEFQRMISLAKSEEHPFSAILVWKFSRFARNQEESIVYKSMLKKQCGIDVISITEPLADGPFGSLIERIIEWMDEYYSVNLSGEVLRGMTEKAMRGGYQSAPCLGYCSPGHGKPFEIVPGEAETVLYIFRQFSDYFCDATAIARSLNECGITTKRGKKFEKRSVVYILRNRFYIGKIMWNGIERDGVHELFVPEKLFQKANDRLDAEFAPAKRRSVSTCRHWLSGLVRCSVCGASLCYNKGPYPFFQCWKYSKGMHPQSSGISEKVLVASVLSYFENLPGSADLILSFRPPATGKTASVSLFEKELEKLAFRERRIKEAYETGIDTLEEYSENKQRLFAERSRLSGLLEASSAKRTDTVNEQHVIFSQTRTVYGLLKSDAIDNETKGIFIRSVLEEIVWDREKNELAFHLYTPSS